MAKVQRFQSERCAGCGKRLWPVEAGDAFDVVYARTDDGRPLCISCWAGRATGLPPATPPPSVRPKDRPRPDD